jgi:hypothetical protein
MGNNAKTRNFVNHPRYGNSPIPSKYKFTREQIERGHWRYSSVKYFPETAIPANIEKQNYAVFPRSIYVDIEDQCEACKRPFIFFAEEQKYWFEELGFWIDAHCNRCIDCRKKDQELRYLQVTYQELVEKPDRSPKETRKLRNIALELYQLGFIKDVGKVNKIR